jgi:hypothetical protein
LPFTLCDRERVLVEAAQAHSHYSICGLHINRLLTPRTLTPDYRRFANPWSFQTTNTVNE